MDNSAVKSILVVEDEADIREILSFNIQKAGYNVKSAASAEEALVALSDKIDLILLDVMLPGMSGYELAKQLRVKGITTPIIFLTALSSESNLLNGFEVGADDYIGKPFSINEVLARIKAVLKRSMPENRKLVVDNLVIDVQSGTACLDGELLELSRKEFDILLLLASHRGNCFPRTEILDRIWDDTSYVLERTVDVHIARIRSKLGTHRDMIKNKIGFGYYM